MKVVGSFYQQGVQAISIARESAEDFVRFIRPEERVPKTMQWV
jgi:hypothetical protein